MLVIVVGTALRAVPECVAHPRRPGRVAANWCSGGTLSLHSAAWPNTPGPHALGEPMPEIPSDAPGPEGHFKEARRSAADGAPSQPIDPGVNAARAVGGREKPPGGRRAGAEL